LAVAVLSKSKPDLIQIARDMRATGDIDALFELGECLRGASQILQGWNAAAAGAHARQMAALSASVIEPPGHPGQGDAA
jgi:hypothetical protein